MAVLMIGEIDNSVIKVDKLKNSKSINQNKYLLLDEIVLVTQKIS